MDTVYDAKLLIVDDNAELLALLCEQLRGAGYGHIRTAQSCTAARACFAAEQPELMILDINLPDGERRDAAPGSGQRGGSAADGGGLSGRRFRCPGAVPAGDRPGRPPF